MPCKIPTMISSAIKIQLAPDIRCPSLPWKKHLPPAGAESANVNRRGYGREQGINVQDRNSCRNFFGCTLLTRDMWNRKNTAAFWLMLRNIRRGIPERSRKGPVVMCLFSNTAMAVVPDLNRISLPAERVFTQFTTFQAVLSFSYSIRPSVYHNPPMLSIFCFIFL